MKDSVCLLKTVRSLSHVQLFVTPWTAAHQASLSFTISQSLLKFIFIELMMLSNHFILYHPLLLPSIFPSIMVFSNESTLPIRWPKYWSLGISPSSEYSRLISFRISWFDLLVAQGTLKSLHSITVWKLLSIILTITRLLFMNAMNQTFCAVKRQATNSADIEFCHFSRR